jgi:hypothetical protein
MLLFFEKARRNMTTQPFSLNEGIQTVIQTIDHRFLINKAGVLVYAASSAEEMEQLAQADAQELQFAEILPLVDHVQAHYADFVQAQAVLEQTWRSVADELLDAFEVQAPGSAREATGQDIQQMLHTLGPLTFDRALPTSSFAGLWYQSLWLPEENATFTQQWVPFLRVFHQRRQERFPDLGGLGGLVALEEKESRDE